MHFYSLLSIYYLFCLHWLHVNKNHITGKTMCCAHCAVVVYTFNCWKCMAALVTWERELECPVDVEKHLLLTTEAPSHSFAHTNGNMAEKYGFLVIYTTFLIFWGSKDPQILRISISSNVTLATFEDFEILSIWQSLNARIWGF